MKQQTAPEPTTFRTVQTGRTVTVTESEDGPRWSCDGCGKSRLEREAGSGEGHAAVCAVLPLP